MQNKLYELIIKWEGGFEVSQEYKIGNQFD